MVSPKLPPFTRAQLKLPSIHNAKPDHGNRANNEVSPQILPRRFGIPFLRRTSHKLSAACKQLASGSQSVHQSHVEPSDIPCSDG